ncbi:DNA adenine methylase [Methylosinus sp. Sm6]|uniref:DNA adenine methylase n=1 Tax=Methylosinus sp. Sm6 TaxID=2866948 RepID=UPI001C99CED3|nr:DNA adenine methylase [Methylosinus sp. Sm6]MBY6242217.1 DNA adenine methylase [Methylosinus sp. Sm6]
MVDVSDFRPVSPASPPAAYIGGKKLLAKRLCALIERTPHELYAEAFVGMGGVFLRRRSAPKVEAINDLNKDVATFFRILQRHYQAFMDMLKWQLTSRAEFERLLAVDPETMTDLERAARFLYLQRLSFGGKAASRHFGISTTYSARFDITKLGSLLEGVHERLAGVTIECLDWREFLARWDRAGTLFYLDPPYFKCEHYYGAPFPREDHEALAEALSGIKGRFILSMSDTPETRSIYGRFRVESADVTYMAVGDKGGRRARELIVRDSA